ncbi:MAG: DHH family phosphoesterase [Clostridiales Family XIII bacterium]|jgi:c-di-AMP phosphodiesterase-like protein|nr:DHH family phosphoesterase [Clostridiales Family XIII bacterium]
MGNKLLKKIAIPYVMGALITLILVVCVLLYKGWGEMFGVSVGFFIAAGLVILYVLSSIFIAQMQRKWVHHFLEGVEKEVEDTLRYSLKNHPLPICVVDGNGRLVLFNGKFKELFPSANVRKTGVRELMGHEFTEFLPGDDQKPVKITENGRTHAILTSYLNEGISKNIMLYFVDMTEYENLKVRYNDEKKCFAYIIVDNYDELLSKSPDEKRPIVAANIETLIRQWSAGIDASILRIKKDRYHLIFDRKYFKGLSDSRFTLLDEAREIETDADFPVSFSIGVGLDGNSPNQTEEYALLALDLALGRGGDQAVVKSGRKVTYFGGKVQIIEKRNKGKSRVMAHALKQLIAQSSQVIIMGHKNPDMDSFGAAIGVYRIAFANNKKAYIVIDSYNHTLQDVYERAEKSGSYRFIKGDEAMRIVDRDTLLVVVDTHVPGMAECRSLLDKTERMVVIDHHRKMESFIDNATLTFMEPNASSTSELIAEILQYDDDIRKINKLEAELLLAGIFVDTNSFSVKTGTRTFEAASWLRSNGGDSTAVRQLLQSDMADFRQRASIIANAKFDKNGIAISRNEGKHENAQIVIAQAADELLDIKGIRASFVIGETQDEVVVSARSLGDINVQVIMERFGGGGHLTMAAAQMTDMTPDEVIKKLKKYINEAESR